MWPLAILMCGLLLLPAHNRLMLNSKFRDGEVQAGHVFWHNLLSALHNNPERIVRHGIPADIDPTDDRLGYFLFNREIAKRGLDRSQFINDDPDWIYRTSEPSLNFRWDKYDGILRSVFLRTAAADPWYAIKSFVFFQPLSVFWVLLLQIYLLGAKLVDASVLLFLSGTWIARCGDFYPILNVTACLGLVSLLPAMVAAPFPGRVADPFAGMVLLGCAAMCLLLHAASTISVRAWSRRLT
jgi:hypothetical protein